MLLLTVPISISDCKEPQALHLQIMLQRHVWQHAAAPRLAAGRLGQDGSAQQHARATAKSNHNKSNNSTGHTGPARCAKERALHSAYGRRKQRTTTPDSTDQLKQRLLCPRVISTARKCSAALCLHGCLPCRPHVQLLLGDQRSFMQYHGQRMAGIATYRPLLSLWPSAAKSSAWACSAALLLTRYKLSCCSSHGLVRSASACSIMTCSAALLLTCPGAEPLVFLRLQSQRLRIQHHGLQRCLRCCVHAAGQHLPEKQKLLLPRSSMLIQWETALPLCWERASNCHMSIRQASALHRENHADARHHQCTAPAIRYGHMIVDEE